MQVPHEWPDDVFDLIVLSEILYFLSPADIIALADRTLATLEADGLVLLVNWRGVVQATLARATKRVVLSLN